jgi:hypothetical protein
MRVETIAVAAKTSIEDYISCSRRYDSVSNNQSPFSLFDVDTAINVIAWTLVKTIHRHSDRTL